MALSAYSGTNIPLPDLHANRDYGDIGTLSVTDATGIVVDTTKFISVLFVMVPSAFTGTVVFSASIDGTTYVELETVSQTTSSDTYYRIFQMGFNYYKVTGTRSAGSTAIKVTRAPYLMVASGQQIRIGP